MSLRETTLELDAARAKYRGEIISKTAMFEGSGSDAPQYACPFHSAFERAHRAGGWLRPVARRSVGGRSCQIEKITAK